MNESDISFMKSNKLLEYDKIEIFDGGEGVDIDRYAPCKELVEHSYFKVVMVSRVLKRKDSMSLYRQQNLVKMQV